MRNVCFKDCSGRKKFAEVADEIAIALKETRNAIWRNDSYEKYYRAGSLDMMSDHDRRIGHADGPENIYIAAERRAELREKLFAALKMLTPEQLRLVKMLKKGMSVTEITATLGITKSAVSNMRIRIKEKIKKYLK